MTDLCPVCNRSATGDVFCPRLTMPWDGGWSMGAVYPVDPYKHPPLPLTDRPTWWLRFEHENDPTRTIKSESARDFARADCAKHAVDWRDRALKAEKEVVMLNGLLECWDDLGDTIDPIKLRESLTDPIAMEMLRAAIAVTHKCPHLLDANALRGAMAADDARLLAASERVGTAPMGCDTADWLAEEILVLRAKLAEVSEYAVDWRGLATKAEAKLAKVAEYAEQIGHKHLKQTPEERDACSGWAFNRASMQLRKILDGDK